MKSARTDEAGGAGGVYRGAKEKGEAFGTGVAVTLTAVRATRKRGSKAMVTRGRRRGGDEIRREKRTGGLCDVMEENQGKAESKVVRGLRASGQRRARERGTKGKDEVVEKEQGGSRAKISPLEVSAVIRGKVRAGCCMRYDSI